MKTRAKNLFNIFSCISANCKSCQHVVSYSFSFYWGLLGILRSLANIGKKLKICFINRGNIVQIPIYATKYQHTCVNKRMVTNATIEHGGPNHVTSIVSFDLQLIINLLKEGIVLIKGLCANYRYISYLIG